MRNRVIAAVITVLLLAVLVVQKASAFDPATATLEDRVAQLETYAVGMNEFIYNCFHADLHQYKLVRTGNTWKYVVVSARYEEKGTYLVQIDASCVEPDVIELSGISNRYKLSRLK